MSHFADNWVNNINRAECIKIDGTIIDEHLIGMTRPKFIQFSAIGIIIYTPRNVQLYVSVYRT
jgi:hypothetical protein